MPGENENANMNLKYCSQFLYTALEGKCGMPWRMGLCDLWSGAWPRAWCIMHGLRQGAQCMAQGRGARCMAQGRVHDAWPKAGCIMHGLG